MGLQQAECIGERAHLGALIEHAFDRQRCRCDQHEQEAAIDRSGERRWRGTAREELHRGHVPGPGWGLMPASIWNRSPESSAERVVGAEKVAWEKCADRSIKPTSAGASWVIPAMCSLSFSIRSSVT